MTTITKLPKPDTSIDALKCPKCKKSMADVKTEQPVGKIHCDVADCPQKPVVTNG